MNPSARVGSVEKLHDLHAGLAKFAEQAQNVLAGAARALQRFEDHLRDLLRHWQVEVRRRQEAVNEARSALTHARAMHDGKHVGTTEQELALAKARRRL